MSSGGHGGRRRGKKHEEEEHENHERWMVSYADMLTLLFVLFVVLFAMSQVDKEKFAALAKGLSASFGGPITVQPGATPEGSVLDGLPGAIDIASAIAPEETVAQAEVDAAAAQAALAEAQQVAAEAQGQYEDLAGCGTGSRRRWPPPATPVPPGTRSTSAGWSCTSWPTRSCSTPSRPCCDRRAAASWTRSPPPCATCPTPSASRATPTTCR